VSGLFGKKSQSTTDVTYNAMQLTQSTYGIPRFLVYGMTRIPGFLLQYENFSMQQGSSGGGKGGGSNTGSGNTYTAAVVLGMCEGPIIDLRTVYKDKAQYTYEDPSLDLTLFLGLPGGTGSDEQAPWSYLTTNVPTRALCYDRTAYVAAAPFQLGSSAGMPNLTFEVLALLPYQPNGTFITFEAPLATGAVATNMTTPWPWATGFFVIEFSDGETYPAAFTNGSTYVDWSAALPDGLLGFVTQYASMNAINDAEPSAVATDYLTEPTHGADFPFLGDLTNFRAYCIAMGFFVSPQETTQRKATDYLNELLQITNSDALWSEGLLTFLPYGDNVVSGNGYTYTPNLTPIFSFYDDDYIVQKEGDDPVVLDRKAPEDIYNALRIEFKDRNHQYNSAVAEATIDMDIQTTGSKRPMEDVSFDQITVSTVAQVSAQLILNRSYFYRNHYVFMVRQDYCLLEAGDIVEVNEPVIGLVNALCRIIEVEHGALPKRTVTLTVERLPLGPGGAPLYNWEFAQGYIANYGVAPGSVAPPLLFNAPPALVSTAGDFELWMAVSGGTSTTWGGCNVYGSLFSDGPFEFLGVIEGPARYGTLTAALPAGTAQPDVDHTLQVLLNDTTLEIPQSTDAAADLYASLLFVDGEIMAYGDASVSGVGTYSLTYLQRGLYASTNALHGADSQWACLDQGIFRLSINPGLTGQTIYFKFPSFNSFQQNFQALSDCTTYAKDLSSNSMGNILAATGATLIGRGTTIVGNSVFKPSTASLGWNADCYSMESYDTGVILQFRAGNLGSFMFGVDSDPTTDETYTSIDFAIYCEAGTASIVEDGVPVLTIGSYSPNVDIFEINYNGIDVVYSVNGTEVRSVAFAGAVLFADSSFYTPGAQAVAIMFGPGTGAAGAEGPQGPAQFTLNARNSCTLSSANAVGKPGGASAWDSDCYTSEAYTGGAYCTFRVLQTDCSLMMGLDTAPTASESYTDIDFAIYCLAGGDLEIYESDVEVWSGGTYATDDIFSVKYDGYYTRYYQNGTLLYTSSPGAGLRLYLDSSFDSVGGAVDSIAFGPTGTVADITTAQLGANSASTVGSAESATLVEVSGSSPSGHVVDVDVISLEVTTDGSPMGIDAGCSAWFLVGAGTSLNPCTLSIYRDGSLVPGTVYDPTNDGADPLAPTEASQAQQVTLSVMDTPDAGTHTYTLHAQLAMNYASSGAGEMNCINNYIKVRGYLR
jgi:Putative phage tail protein